MPKKNNSKEEKNTKEISVTEILRIGREISSDRLNRTIETNTKNESHRRDNTDYLNQ